MKKALFYIFVAVLLTNVLSSCISSEETNYIQQIKTSYRIKPFEEYRLAVGDMVACNISSQSDEVVRTFNNLITTDGGSNTSKSFRIFENGNIILPYFGDIHIAGLTLQEAESAIQKKMQEYFTDAQVQVSLTTNFFYILSKDKKGTYAVYKDNLTIYQALAISGQTTERMDLSRVSIVRKDINGNTITKTFDLRASDVIQSEYYYIKPNDLIYFPTNKNSFFNVTSVGSFLSTITGPLAILLYAISL